MSVWDRLRIGYLTTHYARAGDTFIRAEVLELRRRGHEVHTFSIRRSHDERIGDDIRTEQSTTDYILEKGLVRLFMSACGEALRQPGRFASIVKLALGICPGGISALGKHLAYILEAAYLAGQLRRLKIDHLHNHIAENSATVGMLATNLAGIGFSFTIHGPHEFFVVDRIALDVKVNRATFVACITGFCRSQVMAWSDPADWHKLRIVHCGLEARFLEAPQSLIPQEPRVVCISRLSPEKGHMVLLDAAAQLASEGVRFHIDIVGDGPSRPMLQRRIDELKLAQCVSLCGWHDSDQVRDRLAGSRAMVLASFAEGLPVVIMESLAMGRPVIASRIAGIAELVEQGKSGWIVTPGDVDELARALREVVTAEPHKLAAMGQHGRAAVCREHDIRIEAAKIESLIYESLKPTADKRAMIAEPVVR